MEGYTTRYNDNDIIEFENETIFEIRDGIDIEKDINDEVYPVQESDDLKNIAYKVYGDARLWWIIAEYNNIINPFEKLEVGKEFRYPSMLKIREYII